MAENKPVKFKTILTSSEEQMGWHYLVVEKRLDKRMKFTGKSKRVFCSINGAEPFQCALMPWGDIFYIIVNKQKREKIGIRKGDTVTVELTRDESKYGLPMPAELREVLRQDRAGDRLFHALTAGKQRSMLYYLGKIKNIDNRIHAALVFIEHLKNNDGKIIGNVLYEELKRPITDL